jgi:cytoskeletal protein RodZ
METLGTKLKKLRQDKRISLEEIQKNTKVHIGVLEALEEDRFDNLSPVYVKGFLKIYCEYLEIDSQPFIQEYLSRVTSKLGIVIPEQSLFSPTTSRGSHRFLEKKRLLVLSILVLFFTLVASLVFLRGHRKTVESSKVAVSPKTDSNLRLKSQIKTSLPIINPSPINPAKVAKESPYALRLVLRAKEDGWVKVFIDGVDQGYTAFPGRDDEMELTAGNLYISKSTATTNASVWKSFGYIENVKVWNYFKTDFSDRFVQAVPMDTLRMYRNNKIISKTSDLWGITPVGIDFRLGCSPDGGGYDKYISSNIKVWDYAKTSFDDRLDRQVWEVK